MYFDFGAASFTFVAPIKCPISTVQTMSPRSLHPITGDWGNVRHDDTFNRLFVCRRHPAQKHQPWLFSRMLQRGTSRDSQISAAEEQGRAGRGKGLRTKCGFTTEN